MPEEYPGTVFGHYAFADTDMSNFAEAEVGRDVIAFLASDKARWITGASIPVDGGSKL